jgi:hypothetical protein
MTSTRRCGGLDATGKERLVKVEDANSSHVDASTRLPAPVYPRHKHYHAKLFKFKLNIARRSAFFFCFIRMFALSSLSELEKSRMKATNTRHQAQEVEAE